MEDFDYNESSRKGLTVPWPETVVRFGTAMIRLDYVMSLQFGVTGLEQDMFTHFVKVMYVSNQEQVLTGSREAVFHLLEQLGDRHYYDKVTLASVTKFVLSLDDAKDQENLMRALAAAQESNASKNTDED
jgi:hypothetical protein